MINKTVDEIREMWKKDAVIDKYIDLLVDYKRELVLLERDFKKMKKIKIAYYKGQLSQEELTELNWQPYQFIISNKNELLEILTLDDDLNNFSIKIQEVNIGIELIQSIIDKIKNKSWQIKNIIEIKKFNAGF